MGSVVLGISVDFKHSETFMVQPLFKELHVHVQNLLHFQMYKPTLSS